MLGHFRRRWPLAAVLLLSAAGGGALLGGGESPAIAAIGDTIDDPLSLMADRSPGARPEGALFATKGGPVVRDAVDSVLPRVRERDPELTSASVPPVPADEVAMLVPDPVVFANPPAEAAPDAPPSSPTWGPFPNGGGTPGYLVPIGGGGGGGGTPPGPGPVDPVDPTPPVVPAVPEPSTWAMMILGFFLLGATLRARGGSRLVRRTA